MKQAVLLSQQMKLHQPLQMELLLLLLQLYQMVSAVPITFYMVRILTVSFT